MVLTDIAAPRCGPAGTATDFCARAGQQMIETFDTNKDGEIDYPEFLAMMRANNKGLQARTCFPLPELQMVTERFEQGFCPLLGLGYLQTGPSCCQGTAEDGVIR